jgi:23S rRNA (cytosine1962-C5)-methyltransferase
MQVIKLKSGKDLSTLRKHLWIFSGALAHIPKDIKDGDTVVVTDNKGQFRAIAHYQGGGSIALRIISFEEVDVDQAFWNNIIAKAIQYRIATNLYENTHTDTYRLFHGEGDGIPGLIIDIYNDIAVIQSHSIGVHKALPFIATAITSGYGTKIKSIYSKAKDTLPTDYALEVTDELIKGTDHLTVVKENDIRFKIDVFTGQKTGFFLDQRENRRLLGHYSEGKSVLNCFCYTGGFSMYALANNAEKVVSVDISQKAMDLLDENLIINNYQSPHTSICDNVMQFLNNDELEKFDIVIVDPPAFAKSIHKRHNAVQAYKRLNALALKKVKDGGLLFTFSCSQVVGTQLFYDTIVAAAMESARTIRVMQSLSQGPDHPINIFHPEGHYLKGLMLHVS